MSTPPQDPNDQPRYGGSEPGRDGAPGYGSTPGQGGAPGYGSTPGQGGTPGYGSTPGYGAGGSEPARYGGDQPGFGDDRPAYGGDHRGTPPKNGLGVAALIVGILSLVLSCLVIPGIVGGIIGLVLGVVGRKRVSRGEATNKGVATTGLVLSVVALLLGILFLVLISAGLATGLPFFEQIMAQCEGLEGAELQSCIDQQGQQFEDQLNG